MSIRELLFYHPESSSSNNHIKGTVSLPTMSYFPHQRLAWWTSLSKSSLLFRDPADLVLHSVRSSHHSSHNCRANMFWNQFRSGTSVGATYLICNMSYGLELLGMKGRIGCETDSRKPYYIISIDGNVTLKRKVLYTALY